MGFMLFFSSAKFFSKRKKPCRRRQSWRKPKRTKPTTLAGDDDELVHVRKENRGRNPEPEASLAPNRNAAERKNREADPRARSAENRGADQDVAPLRGPSQNAAAASPDAAPRPRGEKVQVQVWPQQVPSSFRIQGKEEVQVKMRPQQVQTPLCQAQMLGDAKARGKKSGIDQRGN